MRTSGARVKANGRETFWKKPIRDEGLGIYPRRQICVCKRRNKLWIPNPWSETSITDLSASIEGTHRDRLLGFDDAAPGAIGARKEPFVTGAVALGAGEKTERPRPRFHPESILQAKELDRHSINASIRSPLGIPFFVKFLTKRSYSGSKEGRILLNSRSRERDPGARNSGLGRDG